MQVEDVSAVYAERRLESGHFRLVRLLHEQDDVSPELRIDFETHHVDDPALRYTVISHTWGGEIFDHHVLFQDRVRIPVSKSCWDGLQVAVRRSPYCLIWIDQLCINQEDSDEKSRQILLMDLIFTNACQTAMWLGHCPEYSSGEWDEIRADETDASRNDIWDALYGVPSSERRPFVGLQHASSLERTQKMGHGFLLLKQIVDYNSVASDQRPLTEERTDEIPLLSDGDLAGGRELMQKPDHSRKIEELVQRKQRLQQRANTSYECLWAIADMILSNRDTTLPLAYYLYNCRSFQVSDPRDRFYSLRGFASDHESLPDPDYRLSYKDTWRRHVNYFVHSSYFALLITKAGLWERESLAPNQPAHNLPSWLPLWFPSLTPSASPRTRPQSDEDDRIWTSFVGISLDHTAAPRRSSAGGPATFFRRPSLSSDRTRITLPVHPVDSVVATALLDTTSLSSLSQVVSGLEDHVDLGLYRCCYYVKTQNGGTSCCPASVTSDQKHDRSCKKLLIDTIYFEYCAEDVMNVLEFDDVVDEKMRSNIEKDMERRELRQCNHIMVTTSGRLGFVHACTKPGDVLVLIPGVGDVMVLREVDQESLPETPVQDTNEDKTKKVYQVVGDAYLNGVMQGELMKERKADLVDVVLV